MTSMSPKYAENLETVRVIVFEKSTEIHVSQWHYTWRSGNTKTESDWYSFTI